MRALPILLLTLTLSFCQAPEQTLSDEERAQIVSELTALQSAGFDACQTLVPDDCFEHFADDATFITHSQVMTLADFKSIYQSHPLRFRSLNWIDRRFEVDVFTSEIAMVTMQSRFFIVDRLGVTSDTALGVTTTLWKRTGPTWKSTYVHESFEK